VTRSGGASPSQRDPACRSHFHLTGAPRFITGASRGIGRGIANVFSHAGANVVLTARGQEALDAVAGALDPERTLAVAGDRHERRRP